MLANAEVQVPARPGRREVAGSLERQCRLGGPGQVGRPAQKPRDVFGQGVEHLATGLPRGHAFGVRREGRQSLVPPLGQIAAQHDVELVGEVRVLGPVALEQGLPQLAGPGPAGADALGEVLAHALGYEELLVLRPAVVALGPLDLLLPERFAVGVRRVLLLWGPVADVAVAYAEG